MKILKGGLVSDFGEEQEIVEDLHEKRGCNSSLVASFLSTYSVCDARHMLPAS